MLSPVGRKKFCLASFRRLLKCDTYDLARSVQLRRVDITKLIFNPFYILVRETHIRAGVHVTNSLREIRISGDSFLALSCQPRKSWLISGIPARCKLLGWQILRGEMGVFESSGPVRSPLGLARTCPTSDLLSSCKSISWADV